MAGNFPTVRLKFLCLAVAGFTCTAMADGPLTLEQALELGRQKNGTILASLRDLDAAKARLSQSRAAFAPSVTLSYGYSDERIENFQVSSDDPFRTTLTKGGAVTLSTAFTLLDTGERRLNVRSANYGLDAQIALTRQSLRATLVDVYTLYVEALRAQELEKVSQAEVSRAEDVVRQANAQAKYGDIAEKDIFQPRADAANAKVNELAAENDLARARAVLKAGIGWDAASELPALGPVDTPADDTVPLDVQQAIALGMKQRTDLQAQRSQVEQLAVAVSLARVASGPTLNAGYSFTRQSGSLADSGQGSFALLLSYPLYDGGVRQQDTKIAQANLAAAKLDLVQAEREASAEIESLVKENILGEQRVAAANIAVEAARINFNKVSQARILGAEGTDLVAVSTAQVSLVTAETNAVQAVYDQAVSRVKLHLAIGDPVPGETN